MCSTSYPGTWRSGHTASISLLYKAPLEDCYQLHLLLVMNTSCNLHLLRTLRKQQDLNALALSTLI